MLKQFNIFDWKLSMMAIIFAALCGTAFASQVFAVETNGTVEKITLSPSSRTIKQDAGGSVSGVMKIINDGDTAYDFSVYARPYSVNSETYDPNFTVVKANADLYKWVQFEKTRYSIEPGQTVEVGYTINIPQGAAPGGHYGILFAETQERELGTTGVARQKRVGMVVYATVNGEYKTSGAFKEFILPFWQTNSPMISSARVENTGNIDFRADVSTTAKDIFGRTKYSYTGDPIVLPETTRLAEMKWENAPNFGIFKVDQSVEFLDQKYQNSGYVLIAPRWAPVVLIVITAAGAAYAVLQRRANRR